MSYFIIVIITITVYLYTLYAYLLDKNIDNKILCLLNRAQIKARTSHWLSQSTSKEKIAENRPRIDHTRVTHSHIFRKEEQEDYDTCHTRLTVSHVLLHCVKYEDIRIKSNLPLDIFKLLEGNYHS